MNELNVITVPAFDWDGNLHTAFTVYSEAEGHLYYSTDEGITWMRRK